MRRSRMHQHSPNVEHPDTFNRIMMEWLSTQR